MSWSWRTKPRSITKTIEWFKSFNKLEGEDWNLIAGKDRNNKPIHPVRRTYYYNTQSKAENSPISSLSYDEYINGEFDDKETESNARNDAATYRNFGLGYIDKNGLIKITQAGKMIASDNFNPDMFLKQLLKMRYPAPDFEIGRKIDKGKMVYPFELVLKLIKDLKYITKFELSYIFLCDSSKEYLQLLDCIKEFRKQYVLLKNKKDIGECKAIHSKVCQKYYDTNLKMGTLMDYADAMVRSLRYTGLFNITGRGNYTKIRVAEYSKKKYEMLIEKYVFKTIFTDDSDTYMEWFGNIGSVVLPWENLNDNREIVLDKITLLENIINGYQDKYSIKLDYDIDYYNEKFKSLVNENELKSFESDLINTITGLNEDVFIKFLSKTDEERTNIINKFNDIINGDEDMAALWLECNTWKSLVAINGKKKVIHNFAMEEDLTPRSFAPGVGNTPDMQLITDNTILISEVSLMSGVQQWEHEGSSVVDHVLRFIDEYTDKDVYAIFLSQKINKRTSWQFFVLNKNSWLDKEVPIIPLEISTYVDLLKFMYERNIDINEFISLIKMLHNEAINTENYEKWYCSYDLIINQWKNELRKAY